MGQCEGPIVEGELQAAAGTDVLRYPQGALADSIEDGLHCCAFLDGTGCKDDQLRQFGRLASALYRGVIEHQPMLLSQRRQGFDTLNADRAQLHPDGGLAEGRRGRLYDLPDAGAVLEHGHDDVGTPYRIGRVVEGQDAIGRQSLCFSGGAIPSTHCEPLLVQIARNWGADQTGAEDGDRDFAVSAHVNAL